MCGIAGAIALRHGTRPDPERVAGMSCLIAHRGPDGEGLWHSPSGHAVLAHRRLSVIDLATGQQPMIDETGSLGLVFNGEVYNYRELRAELASDGERFRTESDTEVLLRLYRRRGSGCVDVLRGMFAFALWDDTRGVLTLARDRVGKKPLYYTVSDGCFYFASSLKALRETSPSRLEIDPVAIDLYLTLGYIPAPRTVYRGVSKLEAGTLLTLDGASLVPRRFWDLATADAPFSGTFEEAVDRLDDLINTSVALRLRSDVPLGVFLSGGIDSSLVTAVATRQSPSRVSTFSIAFDVAEFDESRYAAQVAERLGTDHHEFHAKPDLLATLPRMVWHYGEPFADSSALPTWLLSEHTRRYVTVALGGDGGDEGFAGYDWYRTATRLGRVARGVPRPALALASRALAGVADGALPSSRAVGRARRGAAILAEGDAAQRFALLRTIVGPLEADQLYAGELREIRAHGAAAVRWLAELYRQCEGSDLRRMRYVDIRSYLACCLMPKVDVATMAHGLEARAPLLDHEVVRFALSLPDEWLTDRAEGKRILRAVLGRYLPTSLFERPKQGFTVPLGRWFSAGVRERVRALPASERLRSTGWLDPAGIAALVDEHLEGRRDHGERLFALLVLDEWLERG